MNFPLDRRNRDRSLAIIGASCGLAAAMTFGAVAFFGGPVGNSPIGRSPGDGVVAPSGRAASSNPLIAGTWSDTIEVALNRTDGGTGSARGHGGIPLKPGVLAIGADSIVTLYCGEVEQTRFAETRGIHPDSSALSVFIESIQTVGATPVNCQVRIGVIATATTTVMADSMWADSMKFAIAPTDPLYMISTNFPRKGLARSAANRANDSLYHDTTAYFFASVADSSPVVGIKNPFSDNGVQFYERIQSLFGTFTRTGDFAFYDMALDYCNHLVIAGYFATRSLTATQAVSTVPKDMNSSDLAACYIFTGDPRAKLTQEQLTYETEQVYGPSDYATGGQYADLPSDSLEKEWEGRIIAKGLENVVWAHVLGQVDTAAYESGISWFAQAQHYVKLIDSVQAATGEMRYQVGGGALQAGQSNFHEAMRMSAVGDFYDWLPLTATDSTAAQNYIQGEIEFLWRDGSNAQWVADSTSFHYWSPTGDHDNAGSVPLNNAQELNLMFVDGLSLACRMFPDSSAYATIADSVFSVGIPSAIWTNNLNGKIANQAMYRTLRYLTNRAGC